MSRWVTTFAATLLLAGPALGEEPAATLDALLERARSDQQSEARIEREREERFLRERDERAAQLAEARRALAASRARHDALTGEYEEREAALEVRRAELEERSDELGDLFVAVREAAADAARTFEESLVSAQVSGRSELALRLADQRELPSVEDLTGFWHGILEEMVGTGQIATFEAPIVASDGSERIAEVVRIGAFTAVSDGRFLRFVPESGRLVDIPRQPPTRFRALASAIQTAEPGTWVDAAVDPTHGAVLSLLTRAPSLRERVDQGGWIALVILALGAVGLLVALERLVMLTLVSGRVRRQEGRMDHPEGDNPLGRILGIGAGLDGADAEVLLLRLEEGVQKEVPRLHRGLGLIAVIATSAPLLGLLGTVTGMIETFQSIALFGTGDPRLMSSGISEALVTTALGLIVAVPLSLFSALLSSRSAGVVRALDDCCVHLVAQRVEDTGG